MITVKALTPNKGENQMKIVKATAENIAEIGGIYRDCRKFMRENGNPDQWGENRPTENDIEKDIENGRLYICIDENFGQIVAAFAYFFGEEPYYSEIKDGEWQDSAPYDVVHRVAVARRGKGIGRMILNFAFSQHRHLRIDTHRDNIPMQNLLKSMGFKYQGIIYENGTLERLAFLKED